MTDPLYGNIESILASYQSLTGAAGAISVVDFLSIRKTAIEEQKAGVWREPCVEEEKGLTVSGKKTVTPVQPAKKSRHQNEAGNKSENDLRTETDKAVGGFELLKGLPDPWN